MTQSGSNQLHGSVYEFLRNNALDAPNYFDQGSAPPFQRNQFGGSLGGPIRRTRPSCSPTTKDCGSICTRLRWPSCRMRRRACGRGQRAAALNLWPIAPADAPDFNGIAQVFSSPLQTIREDFGTVRLDHVFSRKIHWSAVTPSTTATILRHTCESVQLRHPQLREQVFSLEETHVVLAVLAQRCAGRLFARRILLYRRTDSGNPGGQCAGFPVGLPVGAVVVGGSAASNPQAQLGLAGSNNGSNLRIARNLLHLRRPFDAGRTGRHQFSFGVWFQPFPIERNHRAQPVWSGDVHQPANLLAGNDRHLSCTIQRRPR